MAREIVASEIGPSSFETPAEQAAPDEGLERTQTDIDPRP